MGNSWNFQILVSLFFFFVEKAVRNWSGLIVKEYGLWIRDYFVLLLFERDVVIIIHLQSSEILNSFIIMKTE